MSNFSWTSRKRGQAWPMLSYWAAYGWMPTCTCKPADRRPYACPNDVDMTLCLTCYGEIKHTAPAAVRQPRLRRVRAEF